MGYTKLYKKYNKDAASKAYDDDYRDKGGKICQENYVMGNTSEDLDIKDLKDNIEGFVQKLACERRYKPERFKERLKKWNIK